MTVNSKRAIFFDFGDTLASTTPSYFNRIATAIRSVGYSLSDREFEVAYLKTDYEVYKKYKTLGKVTPREYVEWFFPILCRYLSLEGDPYEIRTRVRQRLKDIKYGRVLAPGSVGLLDFLREKGFILAVISNNDGKTEEKCEELGIREYFQFIADSTKLAMAKPDSRIFRFVLDKLGLSPNEVIHVGDLYGSDVMGGINAGLDVIWLNNREVENLNKAEVASVSNIEEITGLLGLENQK
ncbi:MAG TPA: HAD family hydrolase [Thermodesulfobacteriota bacterium]|nr:HAD family hydrolase [Thermodesulfobacteriota bacterium]